MMSYKYKPKASDSYTKYPCEMPGCTQKIAGYRGQEGWVSAWKIRKASVAKYGKALCPWCQNERETGERNISSGGHAKDPDKQWEEMAAELWPPDPLAVKVERKDAA